jgi:hypothetical protein
MIPPIPVRRTIRTVPNENGRLHEASRRWENVVYLSGRVIDEQADPFVHRNIKQEKAFG